MTRTTLLTDEEIQRQVLDELEWDPEVEQTDVGAEVNDGVVTLTGTVASYPIE
ncbi:MAG: BON domain-containing protein [Sphingomonadaceae bacterium]